MNEFVSDYQQRFSMSMKEMKTGLIDDLKSMQKGFSIQINSRQDQMERYLEQVHLSQVNEATKVKVVQDMY